MIPIWMNLQKFSSLSKETGTEIPAPIAALESKTVRFQNVCTPQTMSDELLKIVKLAIKRGRIEKRLSCHCLLLRIYIFHLDVINLWMFFRAGKDYTQRLEQNWRSLVKESDTVVIAGDISWAMKLEETEQDFSFIHRLPGTKNFK